jgi:DNA polymerase III subunit epsilon
LTEKFGFNEVTAGHIIRQLFAMADTAIAHNVRFDRMVVCHLVHQQLGESAAKKIFFSNFSCTMLSTTEVCKLPGRYIGRHKWPTLQELHKFLFEEEFSGAHDAMADVRALRRCYYELLERKLI